MMSVLCSLKATHLDIYIFLGANSYTFLAEITGTKDAFI